MIKRILTVLPALLPLFLAAQITIKGRVIDVNNGTPLAGANIVINNNLKATITKSDGMFELTGLKEGHYKMKVSYIGYSDWVSDVHFYESQAVLVSMEPTTYTITDEVIIQSTRAGEKTPVSTSTIGRETINRLDQGRDMPFLLEHLPATVSTSDAGTGIGYTNFRIRGTDMNRINITVNGIPLNDAESHSVYWVNMPDLSSSVSSLQVQRGVGSSTNGAAAFGASVNLKTLAPSTVPYGEVQSAYGSFNTFRNTVAAGTGLINGKWVMDARLSKLTSDGFIDRASADLKSFYISSGYYGDKTILKFNIFSGIEKTYQAWDGVPSYMLDTNRTYNGMGMYYDLNGKVKFYENETDNYQQDHYQFMLAHQFSVKSTLNLALHYTYGRGYYEQYKDDHDLSDYGIVIEDLNPSTDLIRQKHLDNDFYGYTASFTYQPINRLQMIFGSSGNIYDGQHFGKIIWVQDGHNFIEPDYEWYRGTGTKKDLNVFAKANFKATGRLNLYCDLQVRTLNYEITGIDDDLRNIAQEHNFLFFNPKAGWFFDLHQNGSLYGSFGVAHREPNRDNYTDADPGKGAPKAERLYDYELGYLYKNGTVSLNANAYYMYYHDQLILTGEINDVGSAVMTNVDESYRTGIELAASVEMHKNLTLNFNTAFSSNKVIGFNERVDNWDTGEQLIDSLGDTPLAFSPVNVSSFELLWKPIPALTASFDGKYVSRQYIDNTGSTDRSLDPYFVNNLRIAYTVKPKFLNEIEFNVAINNLFNHKYETNAWVYRYFYEGSYGKLDGYFPQAGINIMGGIKVKL